jgi:transcriptional regulator
MYRPSSFAETDRETLYAVIRANPFGILISLLDGAPCITHLPFVLDGDRLLAHMARANPQWRGFADGSEALCVFQGPHAYVSPRWYVREKAVPTWNYVAVHVHGAPRLVVDPGECRAMQRRLVAEFETGVEAPWSMDVLPASYLDAQMQAIVNFEIPVDRIEGIFKLNQNRIPADRAGVMAALQSSPREHDRAIAALMAEREGR